MLHYPLIPKEGAKLAFHLNLLFHGSGTIFRSCDQTHSFCLLLFSFFLPLLPDVILQKAKRVSDYVGPPLTNLDIRRAKKTTPLDSVNIGVKRVRDSVTLCKIVNMMDSEE